MIGAIRPTSKRAIRRTTLHYQVQKFMQDNQAQLPDDMRNDLQQKSDAVKTALESNADAAELDRLAAELNDAWQQAGTRMYEQSAQQTPPEDGEQGGGSSDDGGEDVVEGEYRSV